jgi:predicted RNase H-like nuclease/polynucleotide 5'-kinase involved in rRNA processing
MSTPESFQVAGVDGCRGGWFVAVASAINKSSYEDSPCVLELKRFFVARTFAKVLAETDDCKLVCVDIPIGLGSGKKARDCDVAARKVLRGQRASSVFPAPIRPCLSANEYYAASAISHTFSGKRLSKQSFLLLEKIRQVDEPMIAEPALQERVREIHPEISFWALNGKKPMRHNKKRLAGRNERIRLLSPIFSDLEQVVAGARKSRQVAPDDILDALVAAWTAAQAVTGRAKTLPENPKLDSKGLRMEILYPLTPTSMSPDWADSVAQQLLARGLMQTGTCLILGAADTGKTTLVKALAARAASNRPVGVVDADIGQSHIGPPATVGWAVVDKPQIDFSQLTARGTSFVGDITPVGHLLQLTEAITQCVRQASKAAELVIVDTPGLVLGPAARALWWTVQRTLQPTVVLAVQRGNELVHILDGLRCFEFKLELIEPPADMLLKSPHRRRSYRRSRFSEYFRNACLHEIKLSKVAVQGGRGSRVGRLVALRDAKGRDMAVGLIEKWEQTRDIAVITAPKTDIRKICCLVVGDASLDIEDL